VLFIRIGRRHRIGHVLQALCLFLLVPPSARAQVPTKYTYWILAEGASNDFFDEDILIGNPNAEDAGVTIMLLPEGGTTIDLPQFSVHVPRTSRFTFNVKSHLPNGFAGSVSAVVTSTLPVVVERTMMWANGQRRGGHNSPGILETAPEWFLAEGTTGFFDTFILIANPDPDRAADVEVKYLLVSGSPLTRTITVAPNGRRTIWVNSGDLDNDGDVDAAIGEFSAVIRSTNGVDIAVERAMYWNQFEGGHESTAVTAPARTWLFAEGVTGGSPSFSWNTFLLLANPQSTDANIRLTFFRDSGGPLIYETTVRANTRKTIKVDEIDVNNDGRPDLANGSFSTKVESLNENPEVPIVAERAMYWSSNGVFYVEGHNTPGVNEEALKWAFAEGAEGSIDATGIKYDSFLLVSNASDRALDLTVTFVREDGKGLVKTFSGPNAVPPRSRFTIPTSTYPELSHQRFSAFLESTNDVTFVAERAVYWGDGYYGGHASFGTPWDAAIATPPIVDLTPTIGSISPNRGVTTGGTDVTITGANFIEPLSDAIPGTEVLFGDKPASLVTIVSDTKLIARSPPASQAGAVDVTVTNAHINPSWLAVGPNGFTYFLAEPTLETDLTLAFGDSITFGTTSRWCDMGGTFMICSASTTGYPERLRTALRPRYPRQVTINVTNAGVPGECVSRSGCTGTSGGRRLLDILPGPDNLVVILEGVNDLNVGISTGEITNMLRLMIDSARSQGKNVILSSLTPIKAPEDRPNESAAFWRADPVRVASLNGAIDALAAELQVPRVNMFSAFGSGSGAFDCNASGSCRALLSPDGLHPNDAGYQRMADTIFARIIEQFEVR
jgi:lysophospholipase L1-like esterase